MLVKELKAILQTVIEELYPAIKAPDFEVTHPDNEEFGDYSTNLALVLAKPLRKKPIEIADIIVSQLPQIPYIKKVAVAAPGFINLYLSEQYFLDELQRIIALKDLYGLQTGVQNKKVMFEYGTPNTHKIPHIGHLFSFCYGESCTRLLEATGQSVFRDNYQGDVGLHVAKALWAYRVNEKVRPPRGLTTEIKSLESKVQYLQECYQRGSAAYEEDENARQEIDELNKMIYLKDPEIIPLWSETRQWSLNYYRLFEERMGIRYNKYYYESETSEVGKKAVLGKTDSIFEESEGAMVFRGEKYGLHTRVFINSAGNPTYEAKDIGLITMKIKEDFKADLYIVTTANEQNEYWQVVKKASVLMYPGLEKKIQHIGHGMINLTTGKMSSRSGNIITAFSLVELAKERVKDYIASNRSYTAEETERIAEVIAIGAIKYSFLKSTATKNITFDLESSIAFDGNSGPYLQYTYARAMSILSKIDPEILEAVLTNSGEGTVMDQHQFNREELAILRFLYRFPEAIEAAASSYSPHILAGYLFELAQRFSQFYNEHQILTAESPQASQLRLMLTKAVSIVQRNGLNLLGIEVLEKI